MNKEALEKLNNANIRSS